MANYTSQVNGAKIAFGATCPGSIVPVDISRGELIVQKGSFLCAEQSVDLKATFTKKLTAGLFGGEGLFITRLTGPGRVILQTQNFNDFAMRIASRIPTKG